MTTVPAISLAPSGVEPRRRLSFTGEGGAFLRLLIRGGLLLIPTLGFYRFWLVTDVRRHLWSHTRVGDEALEYTGTARELLLGFLVALAILAPLYVVYFILGLLAEELQAFASIPLAAVLYVFGQYAAFRARRYRLTRTVFRGVRFWMTGSAWSYAGRAALWDLLTILTLGLAYPWRAAALERYKMRHTRFGDLAGGFDGRGLTLFRRGILLWLLAVGLPVLIGAIAALRTFGRIAAGADPGTVGQAAGFAAIGALIAWLLLLPLLFPLFQAIRMRWTLENVRFGAVEAESDLRKGKVYGLYAVMALAAIGWSAAGGVVVFGVGAASSVSFESVGQALSTPTPRAVAAFVALLVSYLVLLIGFGVIQRYVLGRGLWAAAVGSVTVANLSAADLVTAEGAPSSAVGEGLADALDVGAF